MPHTSSAGRSPDPSPLTGSVQFPGVCATGVVEYVNLRHRPHALNTGGWWTVVATFEGDIHAWRFAHVVRAAVGQVHSCPTPKPAPWAGPALSDWTSSMDRERFTTAVVAIREAVRAGHVYQVTLCRILRTAVAERPDARGLAEQLGQGNSAPYAGFVDIPSSAAIPDCWVVSASPELSFGVTDGHIASGPIKGTASCPNTMLDKDIAENVMITDLVRNDLQRVCDPGTVRVIDLLRMEQHPGLVHLVSRVTGQLRGNPAQDPAIWSQIFEALHPPGSVSGAPKSSAVRMIDQLEPEHRGPYCGQIGWIDADRGTASLAVGIRTFWWEDGTLAFGTGAGITWGSTPDGEWRETELKADRLIRLAST